MKNQVLYASKINPDNNESGKKDAVKRIADAIATGAGLVANYIGNYSRINDTEVLFIGSDVKGGKYVAHKNLMRIFNEITSENVKTVVLYSIILSGNDSALNQIKAILEPKGIKVETEEFKCKGPTLFGNKGHPTDQEVADARTFGEMIAAKYRDTTKAGANASVARYREME